ncbi:hypothetical protein [uncultured Mitsuokella sp.]|uniref:hypothetical protein n=1 Tax=uncultured Mitsuokella sp. TaxID=453120 RepID=UPI00260C8A08|nr:hypothetical protein [uncultured Mitsuokella sp.]
MAGLFPVVVASVNGLTVTTTQGYTLTRIGNKSLREGDTIYTDGKYVYGMEGSGGKQLPMLPYSVNYLFFNPYSTDTMKPGIYGFYKSFCKPVFVCDADYKPLFIGANNAYQGLDIYHRGIEDVIEIGIGKKIESSFSNDYNVWSTGADRPGLDQCVSNDGYYLELRAGQVKQTVIYEPFGTTHEEYLAGAILLKNGEIVDASIIAKWYGDNEDNVSPIMAHINDDGSYQCLCYGFLSNSSLDINHNSDYCDMPDDSNDIVEKQNVKFPPTPPVGANALESKDDGKFHLYRDTESGTEEVLATKSLNEICAYKDSSGRKPFDNVYFALCEFKSYSEYILFKYDSNIGEREKVSYTVTERKYYNCSVLSDEPNIDGARKRYILSYNEKNVYRNGKYVPIYENIAIYENEETGFYERYWFCTDEYETYPLKRDEVYDYRYKYTTKPIDIQVGTDLYGNPIMMTYVEDNSVNPSDISYICCGFTSKSPIKNAIQISGNRYVLLIGAYGNDSGIVVVNKSTGEHRKAFDCGIGYFNTRLVKTSRNVINTIKRVLPKEGR